MDFALTEEQQAIVDLASQILTEQCAPERLREVEAGAEWFDRDLWAELAKADLLGIALPEVGRRRRLRLPRGLPAARAPGRAVAPVPLRADARRRARRSPSSAPTTSSAAWLPGVVDGETDAHRRPSPRLGATRVDPQPGAVPRGDGGWVLDGRQDRRARRCTSPAAIDRARPATAEGDVRAVRRADRCRRCHRRAPGHVQPRAAVPRRARRRGASAPTPCSAGPTSSGAGAARLARRPGHRRRCARWPPASPSRHAPHRRLRASSASSSTGPSAPSRPWATAWPTATSTTRRSASPCCRPRASRRGPPRRQRGRVAKYWASYGGSRVGHAGLHLHGGISHRPRLLRPPLLPLVQAARVPARCRRPPAGPPRRSLADEPVGALAA